MKVQEVARLLSLGLGIWLVGTLYYSLIGPALLETTGLRYWLSFATSPIISGAICIAILRWRGIPQAEWASAMLLLAIPGMVGEAIVLTQWSTFMPRLHIGSAGKYGAFLFATYAVVLGFAEVATIRAVARSINTKC